MCSGDRLVADFVAGTSTRPPVPQELEEHLTTTVSGLWMVWAYKLAEQQGDLFVPLTGGSGYPADARARCRVRGIRGAHEAPNPRCTCGFHALSSRRLPGLARMLRVGHGLKVLTVVLSGRVLAFDWAGGGTLWRAERQTVVRIERPAPIVRTDRFRALSRRQDPDDPDGRAAVVPTPAPRDSGPVRLDLPVACPVLPMSHDDAGWCLGSGTIEHSRAALVFDVERAVPAWSATLKSAGLRAEQDQTICVP